MYQHNDNYDRKWKLNNEDRRQWVLNDEGLYDWWTRTRLPMGKFIRDNRVALDECIIGTLNRKPTQ